MANFKQHLEYGITTSAISSIVAYWQFGLEPIEAAAAFIIGSIASISPDFDHPISTPGEFLFNCLAIILPLAFINRFIHTDLIRLEHWVTLMAIGYLTVQFVLKPLFHKITVHRGIFHSLPAAVFCGECVFLLFFHWSLEKRIIISIISVIGYLTHLIADEIYAVDWQGKKIRAKRSMGTALDMGNFKEFSTWLLYICVIIIGIFIWEKSILINTATTIQTYATYYINW